MPQRIRKLFHKLSLAIALLLAPACFAQTTTVTGAAVDANSNAYFPGTVSAAIVLNTGQPLPAGVPASGSIGPFATTSGGNFSVVVASPFTWIFTICGTPVKIGPLVEPTPTQVCFSTAPIAVSGASQSITANLGTIPLLGPGGGGITSVSSLPGTCTNSQSVYLTTAAPAIGFYDCINGVWQARPLPDPPVTASYALTTAGTQATLDLHSNALDTQQLNWTPTGFTTTVTDIFTYAGGDLHTNNANWVNDTGSFTVSAANNTPTALNIAYGSAGQAMVHRSDGPNVSLSAAEWSRTVVMVTVSSATQNTGPCVYVQNGANSGYCARFAIGLLRIMKVVAGTITDLATLDGSAPVTGDTLGISASGGTITVYKNGVSVGSAADATFTGGFAGMWAAANSQTNGMSTFAAGTGPFPICTVSVDSSPDGTNWTTSGAIPSQSCIANGVQTVFGKFSYVRVNLLTFNGTTLNVAYAGRIAPVSPQNGFSSVSNGQWVNAGELIWNQITSQGVGAINMQSWYRILQQNGVVNNSGPVTISGCSTGGAFNNPSPGNANTPTGVGFAYIIPVSGWLQSAILQVSSSGLPQGSVYLNQYLMYQMPVNAGVIGTTNSCQNALAGTNPDAILLTAVTTGSFYPVGFTGTTLTTVPPGMIPGYVSNIPIASPTAGADFTFTTSTSNNENPRVCVMAVSYTLTTSAGAANRISSLQIQNGSGPFMTWISGTAATASQTVNYSYTPGASLNSLNSTGTTFFQSVPFNNGQPVCGDAGTTLTIKSVTAAIQAADQYSNIKVWTTVQQDGN